MRKLGVQPASLIEGDLSLQCSVATVIVALAATSSSAIAGSTHVYSGVSFGPDGTSGTSFESAAAAAIDQETHEVLVGDAGANSIYRFKENGEPSPFTGLSGYINENKLEGLSFFPGKGESQIAVAPTGGIIYATSGNAIRAFKRDGDPATFSSLGSSEIGGFSSEGPCGVAVDQNGDIYAGDYLNEVVNIFAPSGEQITSFSTELPCNLAVNSHGAIYVVHYHGPVQKYTPSDFPVVAASTYQSAGVIDENTTYSAGVDPANDDLYLSQPGRVAEYGEDGSRITAFGVAPEAGALSVPGGLAINNVSGKVFVNDREGEHKTEIFGPLVTVPTVATTGASTVTAADATVEGSVNPEGIELQTCIFQYGETEAYGESVPCTESPAEIGSGNTAKKVHAALTGLSAGKIYHFRLVATNANGPAVGEDRQLRTLSAPLISNEYVASAAGNEATLTATINPGGSATTYHVDYGSTSAYGQETVERTVGDSYTSREVSVTVLGLQAGATYHWRVTAANGVATVNGGDQTFNTVGGSPATEECSNQDFRRGASARLPDCRAYELVSPVEKNNTDILPLINTNSIAAQLDQSSSDGNKLTYTTSQGFGDAQGTPYLSQYIASRGSQGWDSNDISPSQGLSPVQVGERIDLEYRAFTPNLCDAALRHDTDPQLSPLAPEGFLNVYRRDDCGDADYQPAITATPSAQIAPEVQGLSADGRCVVFYAGAALLPEANQEGLGHHQLYESCDGQLRVVSVLPDGSAAPGDTSAGTGNVLSPGIRYATDSSATSADGSRIYWTNSGEFPGTLFLRENASQTQSQMSAGVCTEPAKACTIKIAGFTDPGEGLQAYFWAASADGARAFYTLGTFHFGATETEGGLYEFHLASGTSTLIAGESKGVIGAGEDARVVSFVSKEVLIAGANSDGKRPVAGEPNLYLFDSTKTGTDQYRFVGILTEEDAKTHSGAGGKLGPVNVLPYKKTSRVSPSGEQIVFMSTAPLTGYVNTDAANGEADAEIFMYNAAADSGEGELVCVSCNPSGQPPTGADVPLEGEATGLWAAALLPPYETELYGARALAENGSRVFFDSYESLVPADTNGKTDAYEWEAPGSGGPSGCTVQSSAYSSQDGGCISLISTGESPSKSEIIDASPDGRDVFFVTASSLLPQDPGLFDIYDARQGGGYPPVPSSAAACEGEACQGPPSPPNDPTPASSAFDGPGNVAPAKKPKHKKSHKGSHKKKKVSHKKKGRPNHNRRAAR